MQSLICNGVIDVLVIPPTCPVAWQAVETSLGFDLAQLDASALGQAFLAGASVCFVPLAFVWAATHVLMMLRDE